MNTNTRRNFFNAIAAVGMMAGLPFFVRPARAAGDQWTVPDGVDKVKVTLVNEQGVVVVSKEVPVKEGFKFIVEAV